VRLERRALVMALPALEQTIPVDVDETIGLCPWCNRRCLAPALEGSTLPLQHGVPFFVPPKH
jgi:hypothetical protein